MIRKSAIILAVIILISAVNSCYYEREVHEELEICFVRSGSIYIMNIDGSEQKQITYSANDNIPSWSPDGKRILFERGTIPTNIYVINSDGTGLKQLSTIRSTSPTWSADGVNIFYSEENGSDYSIVSAKPDGTIIRRYPIDNSANSLSASPDGRYVYYFKNNETYRIDINNGLEDKFTSTILEQCTVSPDGSKIAHKFGSNNIYIYNISTNITDLLISSATYPTWTPDGKTIIYKNSNYNICSINIDGTNQKELTTDGNCYTPCVKWKPK